MDFLFDVTVNRAKDAHALPGIWTDATYRQLLDLLEFEGADELPQDEVPEMALMALQDVGDAHEAAVLVLELLLGKSMGEGVRQQVAYDFGGKQPWAEHSEMSRHAAICAAADVLHRAFPQQFAQPAIAQVTVDVAARTPASSRVLEEEPQPAFVVRLIADGMDAHSSLRRLFQDQIAGNAFPEASSLIWQVETEGRDTSQALTHLTLHIYSSWNWLEPLKDVDHFESTAHPDKRS